MSESWLAVPGYEGFYEVSSFGRVRSLDRTVMRNGRSTALRGRLLTPRPHPRSGHVYVTLTRNSKMWFAKAHRLVLAAFVGPCPEGMQGLHWDDDPSNNHVSNLRWGTELDNGRDRVRNGRTRASLTHCVRGHEFTPDNTIHSGRQRVCRECAARRNREYRLRIKNAAVFEVAL